MLLNTCKTAQLHLQYCFFCTIYTINNFPVGSNRKINCNRSKTSVLLSINFKRFAIVQESPSEYDWQSSDWQVRDTVEKCTQTTRTTRENCQFAKRA